MEFSILLFLLLKRVQLYSDARYMEYIKYKTYGFITAKSLLDSECVLIRVVPVVNIPLFRL